MPAEPNSTIRILQPDDWHVHLRDGSLLRTVLPATARCFGRAAVMPNLTPPLTTVDSVLKYRERILALLTPDHSFRPLMTLYLTQQTAPAEIERAADHPDILGAKLYPAGATTNSAFGVTDIAGIYPLLEFMEKKRFPLLIHGESIDPEVDIFDRERVFIERDLVPVVRNFPELRIVLEHITTAEGVDFVEAVSPAVAATVTPHHLLLNRNNLLAGGLRPHHYCMPVLKTEGDRLRLLAALRSGNSKFFAGTDSAPHSRLSKESACGCAGVYSAPLALELYTQVFDEIDSLNLLEGFVSRHGALFHGLPLNEKMVELVKTPSRIPESYPFDQESLIPIRAGERIPWRCLSFD